MDKDTRVRVNFEDAPQLHGHTGTVVGSLDEWFTARYGETMQAEIMREYYSELGVDIVIVLDYVKKEIALESKWLVRLEDDPEVQELERWFNHGAGTDDEPGVSGTEL